jgi:hypothetical protein
MELGRLDRAVSLLAEADALTRATSWYYWLCRTRFAVIAAEDALGRGASTRATELGQEGNALAQSPSAAAASASHTAPPIRLVGGPNLWFDAAGGRLSYGTGTPKSTHGTRSCSQTVPGAGVVIEIR